MLQISSLVAKILAWLMIFDSLQRFVFASFGGLLMCLKGDEKHLKDINAGMNVYLLMRKANK